MRTRVLEAGTQRQVAEMILNHAVLKQSYAKYDEDARALDQRA